MERPELSSAEFTTKSQERHELCRRNVMTDETLGPHLKDTNPTARSKRLGLGGLILALFTGAGVATSAVLVAQAVEKRASRSAKRLLIRCTRAARKLESQASDIIAPV